jgi:outer membrane protein assembly factor BamE (lipoprotein component of BamABCDE complex)
MKATPRFSLLVLLGIGTAGLAVPPGCMSAPQHRAAVRDDSTGRVTVGAVQREIRVGMSGAQVIEVLGSPNIVATDDERREVWTYDRFSTETVTSASSGGIAALIFGGSGGVVPSVALAAAAETRSQRTLTVIIKFDDQKRVRDFAYHASQF